MTARKGLCDRVTALGAVPETGIEVRLPLSLKRDPLPARVGLMQRLASSRQFALGDRAGVLSAARRRSGRPFRIDVRQRVIVKALVSRHVGKPLARGAALRAHLTYLARDGAGEAGRSATFFDRSEDAIDAASVVPEWSGDRHHFRFIVSPEHGERIADLKGYVREVMGRVCADLGEPALAWVATCHYDTDQPHAHVLVRGRRGTGRDLVIPRDYVAYGFRARAQEVAQERLGDLTRLDAERRVWKETQADRYTALDRRLIAAADPEGRVEDGVGASAAWAALTRGRLRHLEALGLATREGRQYRLDPRVEDRLRHLQTRRDIIRTLNQRRLEGRGHVQILGAEPVRGVVVKTGFHDEMAASAYVVVRSPSGAEHYARVRPGTPNVLCGQALTLVPNSNGLASVEFGRGTELTR